MSTPADISVVVVNFNSARFLGPLLQSLFADSFTVEGRGGTLDVVIVDNASRMEDHQQLEALQNDRVHLIRNGANVGYALANNQGFHVSRSRWHLVINPDVIVQRGFLQELLDELSRRDGRALVGPLATMDPEGSVYMPPNELPDPYLESLTCIARYEDRATRFNVRRRARFACDYWLATETMELPMLSGGCFMGTRELFEAHGLFDPGYPLYYEDTDLFRRYGDLGIPLVHVPSARIVHHFSQSAIPVIQAALYRNTIGARRYFRKFFGHAGETTWERSHRRAEHRSRDRECPYELTILEHQVEAPTIQIPGGGDAYLEVAGNPKFSLAVGIFPEPGPFTLPPGFWNPLPPTSYWLRIASRRSGKTIQAMRIDKCLN